MWQADLFRSTTASDSFMQQGKQAGVSSFGSNARYAGSDQAAEAYRHIRQVVVTDSRRELDLFDLLSAARREETYQPYAQGVRNASAVGWSSAGGDNRIAALHIAAI